MEQVHWKRRAFLVLRIVAGCMLIATGFYYINSGIDEYAVPFFIGNFSAKTLNGQERLARKSFGLFFKRKKKSKKPKEVEVVEVATGREVLLSVGMKACVGAMLLFISFLIMLFYLGIESIFIGWLLVVQAAYEAFVWYDFETFIRYKETILIGSMAVAVIILILFLWSYLRAHKAYLVQGHREDF